MALAFNQSAGGAKKNSLDYIKFGEGENRIRFVGDLLARYCYWKQLKDYNIPVECLAFNREKEMFDNLEKDWFKHYFPKHLSGTNIGKPIYPVWSYAIQAIDLKDGKLKMCGLKKKLFEQILEHAATLAEDMEGVDMVDPTNMDLGFDIVFNKKKTGQHAFNVEYNLNQLKSKIRALTDAEKAEVEEHIKPIDELIPRQTSDEQKAFIESAWFEEEEEPNQDKEAAKVAAGDDFDDDIPF